MSLADKIRKARETKVPVGNGATLIVRRPTDLDMIELRRQGEGFSLRTAISFVVGWDGVTEGHLVNGGDPHPLAFDAEACAEWLADEPEKVARITEVALRAYEEHVERLDAAKKA